MVVSVVAGCSVAASANLSALSLPRIFEWPGHQASVMRWVVDWSSHLIEIVAWYLAFPWFWVAYCR